ncbi:hypothetical protein AVEN_66139-1 [Araneus ventricosus]|uniref:Uncharacterized protein n=1 Tax=Araneus ventricosus TaxID=182803 RepID=A0A4Y2HHU0_ARAVE|nr:hypothetical protein AVEN_66139-1 [Araneus ventricosus]
MEKQMRNVHDAIRCLEYIIEDWWRASRHRGFRLRLESFEKVCLSLVDKGNDCSNFLHTARVKDDLLNVHAWLDDIPQVLNLWAPDDVAMYSILTVYATSAVSVF